MNYAITRWFNYTVLLGFLCLGFILLFAWLYLGADRLGWGTVITRENIRETDFGALLYFSMGTFFRIGYGDQIPTGFSRILVGLEALCSFLLGLFFVIHVVTTATERLIKQQIREELEGISSVRSRWYR